MPAVKRFGAVLAAALTVPLVAPAAAVAATVLPTADGAVLHALDVSPLYYVNFRGLRPPA
ncbi:hypothetical protein [Dactylosporangium salmoneum]|uniref:Uncharacterized protein n=1 Tax=Dactylosporangium salmoneum TaxID=53361 RepID=A0ABP5UKQ1_9ACTN